MATNSRMERYEELAREVAGELNVEPTSEKATHVTVLRMAREHIQSRLITGADVDISALIKIDEILRQYIHPEGAHRHQR